MNKRVTNNLLLLNNERTKCSIEYYLAMLAFNQSACMVHFQEYKSITKMRLSYITQDLCNPSHFTVLVRGIPWSRDESYSETVAKFFTTYYASSYLSHEIVYRSGTVQKIMVRIKRYMIVILSPACWVLFHEVNPSLNIKVVFFFMLGYLQGHQWDIFS